MTEQEQIDARVRELCHLAAKCPGGEGAVLIVALRGVRNFEAAVSAVYDPTDKIVGRCLLTALEHAKERITRDLLGRESSAPPADLVGVRLEVDDGRQERGSRDHEK